MNTDKLSARLVGILYIIGTVSGVMSLVFAGSILDKTDYLTEIAANDTQVIAGALCVLIMGLALALVPIAAYPVLKRKNEALALGYLLFRGALETVTYYVTVISWLVLVLVGKDYVAASGTEDMATLQAIGSTLKQIEESAASMGTIIFPIGALILYFMLYRWKLVPRWLSVWGFISVPLYITSGLLDMFDVIDSTSSTASLLFMPMAFQEMVMALWLIIKGFNSSATDSG